MDPSQTMAGMRGRCWLLDIMVDADMQSQRHLDHAHESLLDRPCVCMTSPAEADWARESLGRIPDVCPVYCRLRSAASTRGILDRKEAPLTGKGLLVHACMIISGCVATSISQLQHACDDIAI